MGFPYGGFHHAIGKREADSDADAYTIGQEAAGLPYANAVATGHAHNPGVITHTSDPLNNVYHNVYNGVAHGYTAYNAFPHHGGLYHTIGKRAADADADAYTIGQVAAGLPFANAVATGHAHNPGVIPHPAFPAVRNVYSTFAHHAPVYSYGHHGYTGAFYG